MEQIAKPMRIEQAFDDREHVRLLFERNAPYPAIGIPVSDGVYDANKGTEAAQSVLPWFRGNWAIGGKALIDGAEPILHNPRFIHAARTMFGTTRVRPQTVVVNLNTPMPAGAPHVDIPSFQGARREHYPVRFLLAMGASGLFERWRVVEAGAIAWFYDGLGGAFDYWPEGLAGAMCTERPPFGNVAILADNDRMHHRIGQVGEVGAQHPRVTAAAQIYAVPNGGWTIMENGNTVATYPPGSVRLSVLWKAEVFADEAAEAAASADMLTLGRVMDILSTDLRKRGIDFREPTDPLKDDGWFTLLLQTYYKPSAAGRL
jgi:hypothetical protein